MSKQLDLLEVNAQEAVIKVHKKEWTYIKDIVEDSYNRRDIRSARLAKTLAETLTLKQQNERVAWSIFDTNLVNIELVVTKEQLQEMDKLLVTHAG